MERREYSISSRHERTFAAVSSTRGKCRPFVGRGRKEKGDIMHVRWRAPISSKNKERGRSKGEVHLKHPSSPPHDYVERWRSAHVIRGHQGGGRKKKRSSPDRLVKSIVLKRMRREKRGGGKIKGFRSMQSPERASTSA